MQDAPAWPLWISIAALTIYLLGGVLAHFGVVPPFRGLGISVLGAFVALPALIIGVIFAIRAPALVTVLAAVAPMVPLAILIPSMLIAGRKYPRMNDVTTDAVDPPAFVTVVDDGANKGKNF